MYVLPKIQNQSSYSFRDDKYLLVGLGNIGEEYQNTRHNAGFEYLNFLQKKFELQDFSLDKKLKSYITKGHIYNKKMILCKPTTFMNLSGESVLLTIKYYNISLQNLIIIHDDLDINFGEFKISFAKGPKEHNGIKSVEDILHTAQFQRIRIGIENRDIDQKKFLKGKDYVLRQFSKEESQTLQDVFRNINLF